jgi:6-phosphogluconolactonase/glucosamine-6-phosphate isomerase/deaminase
MSCCSGASPVQELVRLHRCEGLSFSNVVTFNLDEYYPMDPGSLQVCTSWGGLSDTLKGGDCQTH